MLAAHQIVQGQIDSKLLQGNPAGVATRRPITVYLPPGAERPTSKRYPVLYYLPAWLNAGRAFHHWQAFKESVAERLDRLIKTEVLPPCVVVSVDLFTDFGGSQYVDSGYFGPHASHIVQELIPHIEKHFPVIPGRDARGVFGKSSGAFGALRLVMDFPNTFATCYALSADTDFDTMLKGELIDLADHLVRFDRSPAKFMAYTRSAKKLSGKDLHVMMLLGAAGFYSADKSALGFELPIDLYTGALNTEIWSKWLQHDPLVRAQHSQAAMSGLSYCRVECGFRDQYHLVYGARQLHERLKALGVAHEYSEFDDDHSGIDYRYDEHLPAMMKQLKTNE